MTKKTPKCPMCGANDWRATAHDVTYSYRGKEFTLQDIGYSVCGKCDFDIVLPDQHRKNDARVRDEHRKIDGLLTSAEIKAIRKRLELSQVQAAAFLGGGTNAFSKYERGEIMQSLAMDHLLRILDVMPDAFDIISGKLRSFRRASIYTCELEVEEPSLPRNIKIKGLTTTHRKFDAEDVTQEAA